LTHSIGQGGFGITYLGVWNTEVKGELGKIKTKVPVCIKEYFFKDYCYRDKDSYAVKVHSETGEKLFEKFKEKLIKEANILSAVHHPHIVNVLEVFEENNTAYIIMEYIKGCSLKYMLDKEGVLSENKVLKYTHQIGNALDFVHEKNIVHLDIKPGNILIDKDDNARLIDFGVSKRYDIEEQETSTTTLTLSKGFASIEQYDDEGTQSFSPCPDIYSLGATMYNLLTGVVPVESILRATKKMLPPSAYNSNVTSKTEKAILKAMEIKPEDRFKAVKELLAAIDIPPYELTENTLTETSQLVEDDSTEVLGMHSLDASSEEDDDRTVVTHSSSRHLVKKYSRKNKAKRRVVLFTTTLFFAFIGYAIYSYFSDIESFNDRFFVSGIPDDSIKQEITATNNNVSPVNQQDSAKTQPETQIKQQPANLNPTNNTASNSLPTQTRPEVVSNTNNISEKPSSQGKIELAAEDIARFEKAYYALIASGKDKMNQNRNYSGALEDFKKAEKIVKDDGITDSEDVQEYMNFCYEKLEEQNIKKNLEKFKLFGKFGDLTIAINIETGKYGAIDDKGNERIEFIYEGADRHPNGRAFLRKDGTYDIYDYSGESVGASVALGDE